VTLLWVAPGRTFAGMTDVVIESAPLRRVGGWAMLGALTVLWVLLAPVLVWATLSFTVPTSARAGKWFCIDAAPCPDVQGFDEWAGLYTAVNWATVTLALYGLVGPLGLAWLARVRGMRSASRAYLALAAVTGAAGVYLAWLVLTF
jgi:hypothetical protein